MKRQKKKNSGKFFIHVNGSKVAQAQNLKSVDSTYISCENKSITELCTLKSGYTWHKQSASDRIYKVKGNNRGRPASHYVLLVDDQDTIDKFLEKVASGCVIVADYGQVLKSGWGEEPPNDVKEWIENYEASIM